MEENKDVRQAEPQNAPQDKQPAPLSEARKTALLRYMAVLFAVAFLLVLLSLILQAHSSKATISELTQTSSSALSNVEQLQAQNRDLQDEKQTLTQEKSELEAKQVESLKKNVEYNKMLFNDGSATYLEIITAQQSLLNAELSKVADDFYKMQAVVNLYYALGGGRF